MPSGWDPGGTGNVSGNGAAASAAEASSVAASMSPPLSLEALNEEIRTHAGCGFEICETATNIVPGEGLVRDDVFITNVVKARPPGNRDPKADEVAHYLPWLEQQLALIAPTVVIPVGRH